MPASSRTGDAGEGDEIQGTSLSTGTVSNGAYDYRETLLASQKVCWNIDDISGDVLDVATRPMNLRLELPNPHRKLKPEMYATIRVHSLPERGVLMVPESAVQRERNRRFVFVQQDAHTFEARDVTLAESNGEMVKIIDGLQEGEPIVVKGAYVLKSELLSDQI